MADVVFPWYPQPRQMDALSICGLSPILFGNKPNPPLARLIGYGGAAFGGKTDLDLGVAAIAGLAFSGCKVGFFRRTYQELEGSDGAIERSRELFDGFGTYNETKHRWHFKTGSRLYFRHCQNEQDRFNYQSQAWDILIIDEATHFSWVIVDYLITRNRPTGDFEGLVPFALMTTNPGNIGHAWFMDLFDTTKEDGEHEQVKRRLTQNDKYENTVFIPALLEDNPIGLERDPEYPARLEARDPAVARALRHGDWLVFAGQAFPTWSRERHVIAPFEIPDHFPRWRAMDYGFVHPTAVYWFAQDPDTGRVFVYRELHKSGLTDRQQARRIVAMTPSGERIWFTYASPDMWARKNMEDKVTTSAQEFLAEGVMLTRANNDRLEGKRAIDRALADGPDGKPMLQVFSTCTQLIRTIPLLIRDENNPEDVQKMDGDDPYDGVRYGFSNVTTRAARKKKKRQEAPLQRVSVV